MFADTDVVNVPAVELSFFAAPSDRDVDGRSVEWFTPTDHCRGPWDADACHAGPPTGLLVRAIERALPDVRLARITVDLAKPIPMAGFHIDVEVTRSGKTVAGTRGRHRRRRRRRPRHAPSACTSPSSRRPLFDATLDNSGVATPRLADAEPGPFPIDAGRHHGLPASAATPCGCATHPVRTEGRVRRRCG